MEWASRAHGAGRARTLLVEHGPHGLGMALHGAHGLMAPLAVARPLHLPLLQLRVRYLPMSIQRSGNAWLHICGAPAMMAELSLSGTAYRYRTAVFISLQYSQSL